MDADSERYARAKGLLGSGQLAEAEVLLRCGAAAGHARSAYRLGVLLVADADPGRRNEGLGHLRAAASAGHARACFRLGLLYAHGWEGLAKDTAEAGRWCELAARHGLPEAQFNLGILQATGGDPMDAAAWLRRASHNGLAEAEGCLDVLYHDGRRPRTWNDADTRISVALAPTETAGGKPLRFAEYYVDPAIDLINRRFRLRRDEIEDAVQQFFLELEEPLQRGAFKGRAWKEAIREHYHPERGAFRAYLGRTLVNFVHNWIRDREQPGRTPPADEALDGDLVARYEPEWGGLFEAFAADTAPRRPGAARAVESFRLSFIEAQPQPDIAVRLGLSERTVRSDIRLGTDLLREWCQARLAAGDDVEAQRLHQAVDLLPAWLHYPSADKRTRSLLLLAVIWRRLGGAVRARSDPSL